MTWEALAVGRIGGRIATLCRRSQPSSMNLLNQVRAGLGHFKAGTAHTLRKFAFKVIV